MKIDGKAYRTIWLAADGWSVEVIDQTKLPHRFEIVRLTDRASAAHAIKAMIVRGAPLIGAAAAYGLALALRADASDAGLAESVAVLLATRPTAVNLRWALERLERLLRPLAATDRVAAAYAEAAALADEDVEICRAIGSHGAALIEQLAAGKAKGRPVNILTHCNAGWLATVDWGTALAPVYTAFERGVPLHVWVDETRPRNQGASLTAWELNKHGVPHTLAAHDNGVPFYVGAPSPSIDFRLRDGVKEIPIEERDGAELAEITARTASGELVTVTVTPEGSPVGNWGFDVTPARLVTGLITERGVCPATEAGLKALFPEAS